VIKLPYKLLIYDIEMYLQLKADIWRPGDQYVSHDQLDDAHMSDSIICIAYKWYGEKTTHILTGDNMIQEFDAVVKQADVALGKNSDRFDVKHINTQRMLQKLPAFPEWTQTAEDLEKQLRKHFAFPSQSLDYVSKLLGFGGKVKMIREDWRKITRLKQINVFIKSVLFNKRQLEFISTHLLKRSVSTVLKEGTTALKKMIFYNKKDVKDTEAVLKRVLPYIQLRKNASASQEGKGCITCGSTKLLPTKIITAGKTRYQQFDCLEHKGYGGRATIKYDKSRHKVYGTMG
jgi:hypothetical protein